MIKFFLKKTNIRKVHNFIFKTQITIIQKINICKFLYKTNTLIKKFRKEN